MNCPFCNASDTEVYNSRPSGSYRIWRRRRCNTCKKVFTTYEGIDISFLTVVDSSGHPEPYQRHLLQNSINNCLVGIKARSQAADALASTVEVKLLMLHKPQITTNQITDVTLQTLKAFSLNAYLCYLANHTDVESIKALKQRISSK